MKRTRNEIPTMKLMQAERKKRKGAKSQLEQICSPDTVPLAPPFSCSRWKLLMLDMLEYLDSRSSSFSDSLASPAPAPDFYRLRDPLVSFSDFPVYRYLVSHLLSSSSSPCASPLVFEFLLSSRFFLYERFAGLVYRVCFCGDPDCFHRLASVADFYRACRVIECMHKEDVAIMMTISNDIDKRYHDSEESMEIEEENREPTEQFIEKTIEQIIGIMDDRAHQGRKSKYGSIKETKQLCWNYTIMKRRRKKIKTQS